jgi:glyoxylase-like metal-dependent hydrolase (beta-lactamase superfamily II)
VDVILQDGDHLVLLGGATVVHVPGHTPGAIALHVPSDDGLLIYGDVFDHRRRRLGPPPKPFTHVMDQALASLRRLAELEYDVFCRGHGVPLVGRNLDALFKTEDRWQPATLPPRCALKLPLYR